MTDINNEVDNEFNEVENMLGSSVVDSIINNKDLTDSIESFVNKDERIALKKYVKDNGIEDNSVLETSFKLSLVMGEQVDKFATKSKQLEMALEDNLLDVKAGTKILLNEFLIEFRKECQAIMQNQINEYNNINIQSLLKTNDNIKRLEESFYSNNVATMALSNVYYENIEKNSSRLTQHINDSVKAIIEEIKTPHELTEKVAYEMASKMFNDNKAVFKKVSENILNDHKKEYNLIVGRFDSKKITKQILIHTTSLFIAGCGLIASYKFILDYF